jgi:hypothetical protein
MAVAPRIIVTGLVGLYPVGGVAWDYLQYVIGFMRLGYDVYYYEDTWSWPYHPVERRNTEEGDYSAAFIQAFFEQYAPELSNRWNYWHLRETSYGMTRAAFEDVARTAGVFLNVSGACIIPDALSSHCVKLFLDTDPGYNQIMLSEQFAWSENVERWCASVADHDQHFTYAENIHGADCVIPKLDFVWKTTRMPVVLDLWDDSALRLPRQDAPWTTVSTWNAFKGKLIYKGVEYKSKGHEFEKLIELPRLTQTPLKVAMGGVNAPVQRLTGYGWDVVDGPSATLTPELYQTFIARSRGELSTAKHVYVAMRSGWFSCRSACYLAAGRPVVVQDTGFSRIIPTGEGVLAFSTIDEAAAAIAAVEANYEHHQRSARVIARAHFDSSVVLGQLLEQIGLG